MSTPGHRSRWPNFSTLSHRSTTLQFYLLVRSAILFKCLAYPTLLPQLQHLSISCWCPHLDYQTLLSCFRWRRDAGILLASCYISHDLDNLEGEVVANIVAWQIQEFITLGFKLSGESRVMEWHCGTETAREIA
ncbi:hypothetical protein C8J57DRAFT_1530233 [Mycena rebaudengoi]|nr:hypothetical protein C8J57DRAFT_1530233 [Mycena rebaudengoi]